MKFTLTQEQLSYLNDRVSSLIVVMKNPDVDEKLYRLAAKMKYKFTPNSKYVWLSQKERQLLCDMLQYRLNALIEAKVQTEEFDLVGNLMDTLVAYSNSEAQL